MPAPERWIISDILSKPSTMTTSWRPLSTAKHASRKAAEPVAEAFSTCWTGMPVSPNSFMVRTALMTGAKM